MRISDHFCEIERSRYKIIQREKRICKHCNSNEAEDESLHNQLEEDINNICPELLKLSEITSIFI